MDEHINIDDLPEFKNMYSVQELFTIVQNKKLRAQKHVDNNELMKYRTSIIDLSYFLRTVKNDLISAKAGYKRAVDKKLDMEKTAYVLVFKRDPYDLPLGFMLGYNEVHMTLNVISDELDRISLLEKLILGRSVNQSLSEQALPSKHPSEQSSLQPQ